MENDERYVQIREDLAIINTTLVNIVEEQQAIKELIHRRVDSSNERIKEANQRSIANEKDLHRLHGQIKVLWGLAGIASALASGALLKMIWG